MKTIIAFNPEELATMLASLRCWQRVGHEASATPPEWDIATNEGTVEPLSEAAIDALCERLNAEEIKPADAHHMMFDLYDAAGFWPLEGIGMDGLIEAAEDRWKEHPRMKEWALLACQCVHSKWSGTGDIASAAEDWAMSLMQEYAAQAGEPLVERDDEEEAA